MLAISVDAPEVLREKGSALGLEFPLLSDSEFISIDAYGLRHPDSSPYGGDLARPAVFLIGKQGEFLWHAFPENWRARIRPETILEQLERIDG